ncbi:MAG: OmpH family outer membrane protein [Candidatus Eisenbacteria bacterium]
MRHSARLFGLTLVLALLSVAPLGAADLRIGYIDSSRIFLEYKDAQEAQSRFDRQVQGWRDEAVEKEKTVQQLRQEVRDQAPILSALKRQEKEAALQRAISEYETFIQEIWGPQGRASQENTRATEEVVTQVRQVVEKIASQKGLELVFDSASGFLIYADRTLDLTAEVITELNTRTAGSSR